MTIFKSKINVDSENFKKHRNEMLELIARLEAVSYTHLTLPTR